MLTQEINNDDVMLTFPQIAKLKIFPGRATRRLVKERKIPFVQVGNRHYINLRLFKNFLAGKQD